MLRHEDSGRWQAIPPAGFGGGRLIEDDVITFPSLRGVSRTRCRSWSSPPEPRLPSLAAEAPRIRATSVGIYNRQGRLGAQNNASPRRSSPVELRIAVG